MALGKYRKWFILYLIIVGLLISMQVIMFFTTSMRRAYKFMPFENFFLNNLIIMIFWFLAPIIGVLVAYLFESLLLGIHKKLIGARNQKIIIIMG